MIVMMMLEVFDMMWHILIQSAKDDDAGIIICFFDALDECEIIGRHGIIHRLGSFHRNWSDGGRNLTSSSVSLGPKVWKDLFQHSESNRILHNVCIAYLMLSDANNEPPHDFERHHLHPEYMFSTTQPNAGLSTFDLRSWKTKSQMHNQH